VERRGGDLIAILTHIWWNFDATYFEQLLNF